jgi:hypothetical protein
MNTFITGANPAAVPPKFNPDIAVRFTYEVHTIHTTYEAAFSMEALRDQVSAFKAEPDRIIAVRQNPPDYYHMADEAVHIGWTMATADGKSTTPTLRLPLNRNPRNWRAAHC